MRNKAKDEAEMARKRSDFLEKSYELFTYKDIESVSMIEVAKACGYGTTTLYRYYSTKPKLVVAVAAWKWDQFRIENEKRRIDVDFKSMDAVEIFDFYLDSFLELYRNHKDLLRFNQLFNIYAQTEKIGRDDMDPYQEVIQQLADRFHLMYMKAKEDKTLRTDMPEQEMLSCTLHIMLAVITRYAVGLVYMPEGAYDDEKELIHLKKMMLREYRD